MGLLLLAGIPIAQVPAETLAWSAPAILLAAMLIAWAAESAQFFIAQGFALAILAWMQTLPEFAVEAVLAWKQQVPLLMANLTGALRLLTGLGWPMIYFTAAFFYRRKHGKPLGGIELEEEHAVEVVSLAFPLAYVFWVWWKGSLDLVDSGVLIAIYGAYLWILSKIPPQDQEGIEDLERIPRAIVTARRPVRIGAIVLLFAAGGGLIYWMAEPFLGSLLAVSAILGIPTFVFVQWVAPFVSEFPEKVSAFYWARTIDKAPVALMNMVSSNINQWTLLAAMLPIVYGLSRGEAAAIPFDAQQRLELLMTLGQSLVAMLFLVNMRMDWWEAMVLFVLWGVQFALSPMAETEGWIGEIARNSRTYTTMAYFGWFGVGVIGCLVGRRKIAAFQAFGKIWRIHVRGMGTPVMKSAGR